MHKKHQDPTTCRLLSISTTPPGAVAFFSLLLSHPDVSTCITLSPSLITYVTLPVSACSLSTRSSQPPRPHSLSLIKTYKVSGLPSHVDNAPYSFANVSTSTIMNFMVEIRGVRRIFMAKQALVPLNNLKHNVATLMKRAQTSLTDLARVYFLAEVAGQARATIEAKKRDLERFLSISSCMGMIGRTNGIGRLTREFLKQLRRGRPAQATVVRAGSHEILPLDVEEVRNEEGQQRQDCDLTAAKRLVKRRRADQRQLKICITGDDLYAPEPFILELRQLRMGFVLVANPTSHAALFAGVEARERRGEGRRGKWQEGAGSRGRSFEYRSAAQVPLTQAGSVQVNFIELWERDPAGQVLYHNSWVTDFAVTPETGATISGIGRSRWKIENEQFNVQKNHG